MALHRRLLRSLLQQVRRFKHDGVPLLGVAIPPATLPPALDQLVNPSLAWRRAAADFFRHPPPGVSADHAFAVLRVLSAQHSTLVACDELTRDALAAWAAHLSTTPYNQQLAASELLMHSSRTAAWPGLGGMAGNGVLTLADSLEHTCTLMARLHQETQLPALEDGDLQIVADSDGDDLPAAAHVVRGALGVGGLSSALDAMAAHAIHQHPALFPTDPTSQPARVEPDGTSRAAQDAVRHQLAAVQQLLYSELKLRHEPIEWLYDGAAPLLPATALRSRKAAPFVLALLATLLCARLGMRAMPLRTAPAAAPVTTQQLVLSEGVALPQDVVLRQAARPAAFLPTEGWLVAAAPAVQQKPPGRIADADANAAFPPGCLFLDVSCRGGRIIKTAQELRALHPGVELQPRGDTLLRLCGAWARGMMVVHQRRGESDLVAHWLIQLLALEPDAPEWEAVLTQPQA